MSEADTFKELSAVKGFKIAHLNVWSIVKKIDRLRVLLLDSKIDLLTLSETWLKSHIQTESIDIPGCVALRLDRLDRAGKGKSKKRGGGLLTYVRTCYASLSENLVDISISNEDIEAQWTLIHRPNCKNVVICNIYRPPNGNLKKAILYLDECIRTVNLAKVDLFLLGDLNVDFKNKSSPAYKDVNFFAQSNGLTQHIHSTTRNTNKTQTLIDIQARPKNFGDPNAR